MTEIEKKALALAVETRVDDRYRLCPDPTLTFGLWEALCRAIEQHEAFRQEVSDAVENLFAPGCFLEGGSLYATLSRFIIAPPPKFPVGTTVFSHVFRDPDTPKTVCAAMWDGAEYRYSVKDQNGVVDTGYLDKDFTLNKPDPLVEVLDECGFGVSSNAADDIRAAIEKRGGKIVWGEG